MSDFARLASFQGRGPRSTFWWAVLGATLVGLAPVSSDGLLSLVGLPNWHPLAVFEGGEGGWALWQQALSTAYWIALLATSWLLLAALVRRCHDRDRSGAFLLVGLVPVVQLWALVELGLLRGSPEENDYGWPDALVDDPMDMHLAPTAPGQVVPTRQVVPTPYVAPQQSGPAETQIA